MGAMAKESKKGGLSRWVLGPRATYTPRYLALHDQGKLQRRVSQALQALEACRLCPRRCGANRLAGKRGVCLTGRHAVLSSAFPHFGEEACLRGTRGSGTLFFGYCNLRCVFCQNHAISWQGSGREASARALAGAMLEMQARGCHNLNLVTPEHVVPQVLEALALAADEGLRLPLVYNTSAYDSLETLRLLNGVVDLYMPDFKFWSPALAQRYTTARDYPQAARAAILEMHRQAGPLCFDDDGLAVRGVLVRHLVMPGLLEETRRIVQWLARALSRHTYLNLMDQYRPDGRVARFPGRYPELARPLSGEEFLRAREMALEAGLYRLEPWTPRQNAPR